MSRSLENQVKILREKLEEKEKVLSEKQQKKDLIAFHQMKSEIARARKFFNGGDSPEKEKFIEFLEKNDFKRIKKFLENSW